MSLRLEEASTTPLQREILSEGSPWDTTSTLATWYMHEQMHNYTKQYSQRCDWTHIRLHILEALVETVVSPHWEVSCSLKGGCHWRSCGLKPECCSWKEGLGDGEGTRTSDITAHMLECVWRCAVVSTFEEKKSGFKSTKMHYRVFPFCVWRLGEHCSYAAVDLVSYWWASLFSTWGWAPKLHIHIEHRQKQILAENRKPKQCFISFKAILKYLV